MRKQGGVSLKPEIQDTIVSHCVHTHTEVICLIGEYLIKHHPIRVESFGSFKVSLFPSIEFMCNYSTMIEKPGPV